MHEVVMEVAVGPEMALLALRRREQALEPGGVDDPMRDIGLFPRAHVLLKEFVQWPKLEPPEIALMVQMLPSVLEV
jgi:hypothetical protein